MNKLFVITGPSGVGKTAVVDGVLAAIPNAHRVVTCTSRLPRQGEIDGVHYHFLSRQNFEQAIEQHLMIEWDEHYGNLYGIRQSDVENERRKDGPTIITIDTTGAKTLKSLWPQAVVIFLTAASKEVLEARIRSRGVKDEADIQTRLQRLQSELAFAELADDRVENAQGKIGDTVANVCDIIRKELSQP